MDSPFDILLVEDNPGDARLIEELLEETGGATRTLRHAPTLRDAMEWIANNPVDVMLLDLSLPDSGGLDTVRTARDGAPETAIVVLTGMNDGAIATEAMELGVQDYIVKGEPTADTLLRCIRYARERMQLLGRLDRRRVDLERKNASLQQLTFAMTHDLQTPLASLVGAVEILKEELNGVLTEDSSLWLNRIESSTLRMTEMLDKLNMFSKAGQEPRTPKALTLREVLSNVLDDMRASIDASSTRVRVGVEGVCVYADPDATHRVFANLIGNALKYMPEDREGLIDVNARAEGDLVRVTVTDNGPGIPPQRLGDVMLAFKRASTTACGTGLGLAIVSRYVERSGGRVWLESDGRSGTTAVVELPTDETALLREAA